MLLNVDSLNKNNITLEELEVLERLLRRVSTAYQGCDVRQKLTEHGNKSLEQAWLTINSLTDELIEDGYKHTDIIE